MAGSGTRSRPLFTYEGFKVYQEQKGAFVDEIASDAWVLQDDPNRWLKQSMDNLGGKLDELYRQRYVDHWRALLEAVRVRRFGRAGAGKPVLTALIAERPALKIVQSVSYHTGLDRDLESDDASKGMVSQIKEGRAPARGQGGIRQRGGKGGRKGRRESPRRSDRVPDCGGVRGPARDRQGRCSAGGQDPGCLQPAPDAS